MAKGIARTATAYRTIARTLTGETPFALAFGVETAMHVEIGIPSYRIDHFDPSHNKEHLRLDYTCWKNFAMVLQLGIQPIRNKSDGTITHESGLDCLTKGTLFCEKLFPRTWMLGRGSCTPSGKGPTESPRSIEEAPTI